ncbi:hypothetical protein NL676_025463 [Syzygium grande]|nr:hypothetical protein NL676_025463 [Syzygium grande]
MARPLLRGAEADGWERSAPTSPSSASPASARQPLRPARQRHSMIRSGKSASVHLQFSGGDQSDVNREYFAEEHDRKARAGLDYESSYAKYKRSLLWMSYSRRSDYSRSPSPRWRYSRLVPMSRSVLRSRSRSPSSDVENPGNNFWTLVVDVHLVVDPWTRESCGFGFVTTSTIEEAEQCIKCLDRSVLEGRVITVEKARRRWGRTPTPGSSAPALSQLLSPYLSSLDSKLFSL